MSEEMRRRYHAAAESARGVIRLWEDSLRRPTGARTWNTRVSAGLWHLAEVTVREQEDRSDKRLTVTVFAVRPMLVHHTPKGVLARNETVPREHGTAMTGRGGVSPEAEVLLRGLAGLADGSARLLLETLSASLKDCMECGVSSEEIMGAANTVLVRDVMET